MIDVVEEEVERSDALGEAFLDGLPLIGRDDTRKGVERKDSFGAPVIVIDGEGDLLLEERELHGVALAEEFFLGEIPESLGEHPVVGTDPGIPGAAVFGKHFVVELFRLIVLEEHWVGVFVSDLEQVPGHPAPQIRLPSANTGFRGAGRKWMRERILAAEGPGGKGLVLGSGL